MRFLILLTLATTSLLLSQDAEQRPDGPGYLNVLNLVSLETPTFLSVADFDYREGSPVLVGSESGFIALRPGTYPFTIRNEGAKPTEESFPITVEVGKNVIVICYAESEEQEDGTISSRLRGTVLTELSKADLPRLSVVSLLDESQIPGRLAQDQVLFPQKRALSRKVELRDLVEIEIRDISIAEIKISKEAHYMVFLFKEPGTAGISSSLVVDRKFQFQSSESGDSED